MARSRELQDLRDDARKRADVESAEDRFPDDEVDRYVNQGCAELYDLLIEARGRTYYRAETPWEFDTATGTTRYTDDFPEDFYRLIGVRVSDGSSTRPLAGLQPQEEAYLRTPSVGGFWPTHYELQADALLVLPSPQAGLTVTMDYIPACPLLSDDVSTFDGINGWEEYAVCFAARCIALKDEEYELAQVLAGEMQRLSGRIAKLAPHRDAFRAERVQDVRRLGGWR